MASHGRHAALAALLAAACMAGSQAHAAPEYAPPVVIEATGYHTPLDGSLPAPPIYPGAPFKSISDAPEYLSVGNSTITWVVSYDAGGHDVYRQVVSVVDTRPPWFAPGPTLVEAFSKSDRGARVDFGIPGASDMADIDVGVASSHKPGSRFPPGNTTVTFTATDDSGNEATRSMVVAVRDWRVQNLELEAGGDHVRAEWDALRDHEEYRAVLRDAATGEIVQAARIGATSYTFSGLGPGVYEVRIGAQGDGSTSVSRTVHVGPDTEPPVLSVPADIQVEATWFGGIYLGQANATDGRDPSPLISNDAPDRFKLGTTAVTWRATDSSNNTATAVQLVTLADTTPPQLIALPASGVYVTDNPRGIPIEYNYGAYDYYDLGVEFTASKLGDPEFAPPKYRFMFLPVGNHTFAFNATDKTGNSAIRDVEISVKYVPREGPLPITDDFSDTGMWHRITSWDGGLPAGPEDTFMLTADIQEGNPSPSGRLSGTAPEYISHRYVRTVDLSGFEEGDTVFVSIDARLSDEDYVLMYPDQKYQGARVYFSYAGDWLTHYVPSASWGTYGGSFEYGQGSDLSITLDPNRYPLSDPHHAAYFDNLYIGTKPPPGR